MSAPELTVPRRCSPHSRTAVLQSERVLAAIEARLRSTAAHVTPHNPSLEALGDAYTARLAGHALDNLDRAIISYRLAERRLRDVPDATLSRARLLTKLGKGWYNRVVLAQDGGAGLASAVHVDAQGHLTTAHAALEEAIKLFHEKEIEDNSYVDALRMKGLVCARLCRLLSDGTAETTGTEGKVREKLSPYRYAEECIGSLEPVLLVGDHTPNNSGGNKISKESIDGVDRAEAIMCLAQAYVAVDGGREQIGRAVGLLASVNGILKEAEAEGKCGESLDKMRREAEAQIVAMSGSVKVVESRCVVC